MGGPRSRRHLLLFHLFYKLAYYDLHLGSQCYFACLSRVLDSEKCFDLDWVSSVVLSRKCTVRGWPGKRREEK